MKEGKDNKISFRVFSSLKWIFIKSHKKVFYFITRKLFVLFGERVGRVGHPFT